MPGDGFQAATSGGACRNGPKAEGGRCTAWLGGAFRQSAADNGPIAKRLKGRASLGRKLHLQLRRYSCLSNGSGGKNCHANRPQINSVLKTSYVICFASAYRT